MGVAFSSLEAPFNITGRNGDGLIELKGNTTTITNSKKEDDDLVNYVGNN